MRDAVLQSIRLHWKSIVLAPLVVPVLCAALLTLSSPGGDPFFGFLLFTAIGSIISYAATVFLLLPSLYLISRFIALRWYSVCLCGLLLGVAVYFPIAWICFRSSGPDSGPPIGTFFEYLWRSRTDLFNLFYPIAGLITSLAYWLLAPRT